MELWVRVIMLSAVSLFLFIGIAIGVDTWQFRNASEAGTAEIISLRTDVQVNDDDNSPSATNISYYPTIRYVTSQGDYFEVETAQALREPIAGIGDHVAIRYITGSRGQARLDYGAWRDWLIAGSITLISLFFFVITMIFTRPEVPEI
ncbi:DUF3592 domain-containing protein [Parasphingorhabdus sp.]|uniref:DUF3592 domain-containing protein n=1 Tax=Parasphingorhabdus sp. TaxID=2709688 RepID=UPI002B264DDC|nr:DUF3592 domain-containing protein [Parasphingorhabdus sp.]